MANELTVAQRITNLEEVVSILVEEFGQELVKERIVNARKRRADDAVKLRKSSLAAALADGRAKRHEVIEENSVVAGVESGGPVAYPTWIDAPLSNFTPSVKEQLLGKPAGSKLATDSGSTLEIVAAYEVVS